MKIQDQNFNGEGAPLITGEVFCVYFRASDGKRPSDISRNMHLIDALITDVGSAAVMMTDPRDSLQYVVAFSSAVDSRKVESVTVGLNQLRDQDQEPLVEAWSGKISARQIGPHL